MATSRPRAVVDYQLLHDIFDASPIGIVVEDLEGQLRNTIAGFSLAWAVPMLRNGQQLR